MPCSQCAGIERQFGEKAARKELRRYRRRGPVASTRLLIQLLREAGVEDRTLLDVGGGIGAIQHELFDSGLRSAVQVDASPAYLSASRQEAERRGRATDVTYIPGDFVELAGAVPEADLVTLDRVVCCYPEMNRLVDASAGKARRLYGLVLPRERLGAHVLVGAVNLAMRLRTSPFRVYLHAPSAVDAAVRRHGFERRRRRTTFLWHVWLYERPA